MDSSIRPPITDIFYPTFFLLQLNPTYMKRILHLVSVKNITFKSSYNWFKIDVLRLLRPPTPIHVQNAFLQSGSDSRRFLKEISKYLDGTRDPPLHVFNPSCIHVPFVLFLALLLFHTCTYILRAQILETGGTALDAVTEAVSQ